MGFPLNSPKLPKCPKIVDQDFIEAILNVHCFFESDTKKTELWFNTKNPHFGYIKPQDLLLLGRSKKVNQMITNMLEGNLP